MPSKRRNAGKHRKVAASSAIKTIFVIMPFSATHTRTEADLTEFFQTNLRDAIENSAELSERYLVRRSDDAFNITERIIHDLYNADIVICDLSGVNSNPNVMYELGVRLGITDKPVILIREASPDNKRIFDIQGFYAFEYSPTRYRQLERHLIQKLRKFESGEESYESPVLKLLQQNPSIVRQLQSARAAGVLRMLADGFVSTHAIATRIVATFLENNGIEFSSEENVTDVLYHQRERLRPLNWATIRLMPRLIPAMQTLLSERLLAGLLPGNYEERISHVLSLCYANFYAIDSVWDAPAFIDVFQYFLETTRVSALALTIASYLESKDDNLRAKELLDADELLSAEGAALIKLIIEGGPFNVTGSAA